MITLLTAGAIGAILEDTLVPIFICVILLCCIVWLTSNAKKHEMDKKTELAMKAIENGAEVEPGLFSNFNRPAKGFKEKKRSPMRH